MEDKRWLALFGLFILAWVVMKPWSHHSAEPVEDSLSSSASASPRAAARQTTIADPGPSSSAAPPSSAVRGAAAPNEYAAPVPRPRYGGSEQPLGDATAAGERDASASSPSPRLGSGASWQTSTEGGGRSSASAGVQNTAAAGRDEIASAGVPRGGPGAPPAAAGASGAPAGAFTPSAKARRAAASAGAGVGFGGASFPPPQKPGKDSSAAGEGAAAAGPGGPSAAAKAAAAAETGGGGGGSGGGGGGGGGGGSGGGGGGAGGGSGLSPSGIDAKPKGSAGKPSDAAAGDAKGSGGGGSAGAGGGGGSGGAGSGAGNPDASNSDLPPLEVTNGKALEGTPQVNGARKTGDMFALKPNGPNTVHVLETITDAGKIVIFTAKMAIDVDGAGSAYTHDPYGKPDTAGHDANNKPWNPLLIPYVVIPPDMGHGVKLGDLVAVAYKGQTVFGIVGDIGPPHVVGEASPAVAKALRINSDAIKGGVDGGVTYHFFAGTAGAPPGSFDEIQARGAALTTRYGVKIGPTASP